MKAFKLQEVILLGKFQEGSLQESLDSPKTQKASGFIVS